MPASISTASRTDVALPVLTLNAPVASESSSRTRAGEAKRLRNRFISPFETNHENA